MASQCFCQGLWLANVTADVIGRSINRRGVAYEFPHHVTVSFSFPTRFLYGFPFQRAWTVLWSMKHPLFIVQVGAWTSRYLPWWIWVTSIGTKPHRIPTKRKGCAYFLRCYLYGYTLTRLSGPFALVSEAEAWGIVCNFKVWSNFLFNIVEQYRVILDRFVTGFKCIKAKTTILFDVVAIHYLWMTLCVLLGKVLP